MQRATQINTHTHTGYLAQAAALMETLKDCTLHAGSIFPDSYTWVAISFPWRRRRSKKNINGVKEAVRITRELFSWQGIKWPWPPAMGDALLICANPLIASLLLTSRESERGNARNNTTHTHTHTHTPHTSVLSSEWKGLTIGQTVALRRERNVSKWRFTLQ